MTGADAIRLVGLGLLCSACGGGSYGEIVPGPVPVTLQNVQTQVFSPSCATFDCHTGSSAPLGLDLGPGQSAANLVNVASVERPQFLRVEPGNARDSYVYMKITADPRIGGDPMPAIGGPLSAGDIELIETWIEQGAP